MKRIVSDYVKYLGGTAQYSGNQRIMYINDPKKREDIQSIEECILNKFGYSLPFKLQTN